MNVFMKALYAKIEAIPSVTTGFLPKPQPGGAFAPSGAGEGGSP